MLVSVRTASHPKKTTLKRGCPSRIPLTPDSLNWSFRRGQELKERTADKLNPPVHAQGRSGCILSAVREPKSENTGSATDTRYQAWSLRDPGPARQRRHGRGVPCSRLAPRPRRRCESPARAPLFRRSSAQALRTRSPGRRCFVPSQHPRPLRRWERTGYLVRRYRAP